MGAHLKKWSNDNLYKPDKHQSLITSPNRGATTCGCERCPARSHAQGAIATAARPTFCGAYHESAQVFRIGDAPGAKALAHFCASMGSTQDEAVQLFNDATLCADATEKVQHSCFFCSGDCQLIACMQLQVDKLQSLKELILNKDIQLLQVRGTHTSRLLLMVWSPLNTQLGRTPTHHDSPPYRCFCQSWQSCKQTQQQAYASSCRSFWKLALQLPCSQPLCCLFCNACKGSFKTVSQQSSKQQSWLPAHSSAQPLLSSLVRSASHSHSCLLITVMNGSVISCMTPPNTCFQAYSINLLCDERCCLPVSM